MAQLPNCQFVEIKLDGKAIKGSCQEASYKDWIECFASSGIGTQATKDNIHFDPAHLSIIVTKESFELLPQYLSGGHKDITITIVHRGSDQHGKSYEKQRVVYAGCDIHRCSLEDRDNLYIDVSFTFHKTMEITLNVPNKAGTGLDKAGPLIYNIPEKKLA